MSARVYVGALIAFLAVAGCSSQGSSETGSAPAKTEGVSSGAPASFVNQVWVVAESQQVAPGALRVFLSDGTLVMAGPHGTPALGSWRYQDGRLNITEEGLQYDVDILELSRSTFRIRIHSPGEPVEIRFKLADQPALAQQSADQPKGRLP